MNIQRFTHLATVALGLGAFSTASCAEKSKPADPAPPAPPAQTAPAEPAAADARWRDIKDLSFDQRADFFAGLKRLEARADEQIAELNAIRATRTSADNTKDWDFAMKEMLNARAYLRGMGEDLEKATPETWAQLKDKVGEAWLRTQEAYRKVKASTTA